VKKKCVYLFEIKFNRFVADYDTDNKDNSYVATAVNLIYRGYGPLKHVSKYRILKGKALPLEEWKYVESLTVDCAVVAKLILLLVQERFPFTAFTAKDIYNICYVIKLRARDSRYDTAAFI